MTVDRVAFTVFGKDIYWYGVVIATAVLLGALTAGLREKRSGMPRDTAVDFALIGMPVALVFARLYYVAFEWDRFRGDLSAIFDVRSGGLAIYGGVIGGALAAIFVAKKKKVLYGALADLLAPSLALGQAIGRWGNFFNQEAYGGLVQSAKWQFFPASVYIEASGQWYMATFFYESVWCLCIWLLLEILVRKGFFRKRKPGDVFFGYALLYSAERAVVEGLRTDSLYFGTVRVSQLLSALAIPAILVWFLIRAIKGQRGAAAWIFFTVSALGAAGAVLQALGLLPASSPRMLLFCAVALVNACAVYVHIPARTEPIAAERPRKV